MHDKWDAIRGSAGFFITMAGCLLAVAICGYFLLAEDDSPPAKAPSPVRETAAATPAPAVQMPERLQEEPAPVTPSVQPASAPAVMPEVDPTPIVAEAPQVVVTPLEGEVVTVFSVNELLYNPTLEDWRIHDGVDISAPMGTGVLAARSGTVTAVEDDPMMGTTVTIQHPDGYYSCYANLQSEVSVQAGDAVCAGQLIGAVGDTAAAEAAHPPHLHFSVTCYGDAVDPQEFLDE